ncbi:hypothetical protein EAE91_14235 [Photorhabdus noenieputensis]|uniref:hypothetical protein n=1 Tax=Photorhabdus noenieputensis TaxID=1208607 RepID=UPI001BD3C870|nr:hypothetical protein [Photorhabdus noenieputensis]MBS9438265.1 hypothetical protein [Photorhabdus noenieputensis]MCK3669875.1 hypothetical protein [Photorhabdus noenieputensis]
MGQWRSRFNGRIILLSVVVLSFSISAIAAGPDCSDINGWATQLTANSLNDFGIDRHSIDFDKTQTSLILSERLNKSEVAIILQREIAKAEREKVLIDKHEFDDVYLSQPIYRQMYHVTFTNKSRDKLSFITTTLASDDECSIGIENIYQISKEIKEY